MERKNYLYVTEKNEWIGTIYNATDKQKNEYEKELKKSIDDPELDILRFEIAGIGTSIK